MRHPDGDFPQRRVVKAGPTGVGEHPRQLFWCYPDGSRTGVERHRFVGVLARGLLPGDAAHVCPDCLTSLEVHEGPAHGRSYRFSTRSVAAALVAVGNGLSYAQAARTVRAVAGRHIHSSRRRAERGANGTLVGDWVASYGSVVTSAVTPDVAWPRVVALDDVHFLGSKARRKAAVEMGRDPGSTGWGVLGAYALPDPMARPVQQVVRTVTTGPADEAERRGGYLFALGATADVTAAEAAKFLVSRPGRPQFVVCDGGPVWPGAVRLAWPDVVDPDGVVVAATPRVLGCTWHLGQDLRRWMASDWCKVAADPDLARVTPPPARVSPVTNRGLANKTTRPRAVPRPNPDLRPLAPDHPLWDAVPKALVSVAGWDAFYAAAQAWDAEALLARLGDGTDVRELLLGWPLGLSRSTGGLEAALVKIKRRIGGRSATLANTARTQRLLDPFVMAERGFADERLYNQLLHDHLVGRAGRPTAQRAGVTGGPRLQGLPAQRSPLQQPKLGPPTPYLRRR